jgi:hypothetical protein
LKRALPTSLTALVAAAAAGALIAATVPEVAERVRSSLALTLEARRHASPSVFLVLAVHNFAACAWPLALRGLALDRSRCLRIAFGISVAVALIANGAVVGVALGAYGLRVLAFLPHLPLEWAALAGGCAGWFDAGIRLRSISLIVAVLVTVAAAVETWVAPL